MRYSTQSCKADFGHVHRGATSWARQPMRSRAELQPTVVQGEWGIVRSAAAAHIASERYLSRTIMYAWHHWSRAHASHYETWLASGSIMHAMKMWYRSGIGLDIAQGLPFSLHSLPTIHFDAYVIGFLNAHSTRWYQIRYATLWTKSCERRSFSPAVFRQNGFWAIRDAVYKVSFRYFENFVCEWW